MHRDRTPRTGQRRHKQRSRRQGIHTCADEGNQGRTAAPLRRGINISRTTLATHHSNDPPFYRHARYLRWVSNELQFPRALRAVMDMLTCVITTIWLTGRRVVRDNRCS